MKIWNISVNRPVTVFMGLICVLVLGLISFSRLKLAFLPNVDFPGIWVQVSYPNQNPLLLEREITKPLEEGLSTLKGVKKISSQTSADDVTIRLEFDWGMELDLIRLELGLKLEEIKPNLPDGIRNIAIFSFNTNDIPVVEARISAPGMDLSENYDLLETRIKKSIERVPGVAKVELGGVLPKEVSIELKIDKIKEHGIDVGSIIQKLSNDNTTLSAGKIRTDGKVYNVRGIGKIEDLQAFKEMVVHDSGLTLEEVADVLYEEPPIGYKRHLNGTNALALEVYKESTANTVEVATAVNQVIHEIGQDPALQGINVFVWGDQAEMITQSLNSLAEAGLYGALFAILVLYFFLRRLDATLIVATAIPISLVGAFFLMDLLGYTLNVLTMMGLMLAVGMLVDNAVVVLESIYQKKQEGLSAKEATSEGTKEVITAMVAATMTTMIVFLSLIISDKNELSTWLSAVGVTICLTMGASLFVSVLVIPLFSSRLFTNSKRKSIALQDQKSDWMVTLYGRVLDWSIERPVKTGFMLLLLVVSTVFPISQISKFKGTGIKTERLTIEYELHDFFFLSDVERVANKLEPYIETKREAWGIESIYSWMQENEGVTIITFKDKNMPPEQYREYRRTLREEWPEVGGVTFRFRDDEQNSDQAIRIQLFGTDTYVLDQVSAQVAQAIQGVQGLYDIKPGEKSGKKELQVHVDREAAAKYGIDPKEISEVFAFTLGGTYLPRFQNGERETEVSIGLRIEDRATITDLEQIPLGSGVKLGSVAKFSYHDRPTTIRRVDRKAHTSVRATFEGENRKAMMEEVASRMDNFKFPPGITWSWSNRILQEENDMSNLFFNLIIALVLIYLVMASLFESLTQPLMILSTILFSLVGGFWFLFLTRTEFHVMTGIGLMILLGIVVNNGIILMDHINQLKDRGMNLKDAVKLGARQRIRPILMTAATTIMGMIPLALGKSSVGDAYYFPLARIVIGGLGASTLLTLIGLPFIILSCDWGWAKIKSSFRWLASKMPFRRKATPASESLA